jgi:hypothetical protein
MTTKTVFLCVGILLLGAAAAVGSIAVGPLTVSVEVEEGGVGGGSFRVTNDGDAVEEVSVILVDWTLSSIGELQVLPASSLERSLSPWIAVAPVAFQLAPGEVREVRIEISLPEGRSGDHWGMLLVEGSEVTSIAETTGELRSSVGVKVRYGVKVFHVDPDALAMGAVTSMSIAGAEPLALTIRFENLGGRIIREATGWVELYGADGGALLRVPIVPFTALPGGARELRVEFPASASLAPGDYLALCVMDYGGGELSAGELQFSIE